LAKHLQYLIQRQNYFISISRTLIKNPFYDHFFKEPSGFLLWNFNITRSLCKKPLLEIESRSLNALFSGILLGFVPHPITFTNCAIVPKLDINLGSLMYSPTLSSRPS
jgi:hypothetical protein